MVLQQMLLQNESQKKATIKMTVCKQTKQKR